MGSSSSAIWGVSKDGNVTITYRCVEDYSLLCSTAPQSILVESGEQPEPESM